MHLIKWIFIKMASINTFSNAHDHFNILCLRMTQMCNIHSTRTIWFTKRPYNFLQIKLNLKVKDIRTVGKPLGINWNIFSTKIMRIFNHAQSPLNCSGVLLVAYVLSYSFLAPNRTVQWMCFYCNASFVV